MEKAEGTAGGRHVSVKYPGVCGGTLRCLGLERLSCERVVVEAEPRGATARAACVLEEGLCIILILHVLNLRGSVCLI